LKWAMRKLGFEEWLIKTVEAMYSNANHVYVSMASLAYGLTFK